MLSLNCINRERRTSQRSAATPTDIFHVLKTYMGEILKVKYMQLVLHQVSFGSHLSSKFEYFHVYVCVHVCAGGRVQGQMK